MTSQVQEVIDIAVKMATRAALNGRPVARIVWYPPTTGSADPRGFFGVEPYVPGGGSERPPWW